MKDRSNDKMLNYYVTVTRDITLVAVIAGLLYAYAPILAPKTGRRIMYIGTGLGLGLAFLMAMLKYYTKALDVTGGMGWWTIRIFAVSLAALIIFYIFAAASPKKKVPGIVACVAGASVLTTSLTYAFFDVFGYPFNFTFNDDTVLSTNFLYRLIGYILALILGLLVFLAVRAICKRLDVKAQKTFLYVVLFINGFAQASKIIQALHARRILKGHALFVFSKYTSNYSDCFIYAALAVVSVIAVVLMVRSANVNEPYENPAQHRKIRAKWRNTRRWCAMFVCCVVVTILTLTLLTSINNKPVEISPTEKSELRGENVYVPVTQVEDGHLHRFSYVTPDNIEVRFIVVKKTNGNTYGVGLDACDICGETGYYERNGQVVCNLCDVVMNVNTIGFKGGCNPIVIDYSVENGYIIVPTYTLVEHQDEFK